MIDYHTYCQIRHLATEKKLTTRQTPQALFAQRNLRRRSRRPRPCRCVHLPGVFLREHHQTLAREAAEKHWTPLDFLGRLIEGEVLRR